MAKGFFTQSACLLTDGSTSFEHIKAALKKGKFDIVKELPTHQNWHFSGPTLIVAYLPEVNGYVSVDVVDKIWPDAMGDPKSDPMTFGAWSMGQFGPLTFPRGLARAGQHAWNWQPGRTVAEQHRGFIRIRLSYAFGAKDDDPIFPNDIDPLAELRFVSRIVLALFKAPGAICYYNPNGEVLRDEASFREVWDGCEREHKTPLALWMNVRFFNLDDKLGFMDTVGNGQLDLQDVEAIYPKVNYEPGVIDYYLRNVTHYLMELGRPLQTGEDIDGPGESNLSWTIEAHDNGIVDPPRRLLRLYPKANRKAIQKALGAVGGS
jgi:hypothetical protein